MKTRFLMELDLNLIREVKVTKRSVLLRMPIVRDIKEERKYWGQGQYPGQGSQLENAVVVLLWQSLGLTRPHCTVEPAGL